MGLSLTTTLFAGGVSRTRMFVGVAVMVAGVEMYYKLGAIRASDYPAMPYVPYWPSAGLWLPWIPLVLFAVFGVALALGSAPKIVGGILVPVMALFLLGDQRTYSNHLYFLVLLVALLAFASHTSTPAWPIDLLKFQASVLYGFGALTKISVPYLTGWMIAGNLDRDLFPWIPPWGDARAAFAAVAVFTILLEAWLAIALWQPHRRRTAVLMGLALHLGCFVLLKDVRVDLLVFGLASVGLYPLFPDRSGVVAFRHH
jgi:hypothetical protein